VNIIPSGIIAAALREPAQLRDARVPWEVLIHSAREADLLGTLAFRAEARACLPSIPPAPRAHLIAAGHRYRAQQAAVRREIREIACALQHLDVPVILLKGAAYLVADLPPARGRFFSDIDILVPKGRLPDVESALMLDG
jgi:hypothetical protein